MMDGEPNEGEPEALDLMARKSIKPQSLAWTTTAADAVEEIGSTASTPNDDYKTPSTETAPYFAPFHASPQHTRSVQPSGTPAAAVTLDDVSKVCHRTGGQSYVLQDWPDGSMLTELAPGIPGIVSQNVSQHINTNSGQSLQNRDIEKKVTNGEASQHNGVAVPSTLSGQQQSLSSGDSVQKPTQIKKTTFAVFPNQTTWAKDALQRSGSDKNVSQSSEEGEVDSGASGSAGQKTLLELSDIRQKMEERRRQIEEGKRRMEAERSKQRQAVGKDALIAVMSKSASGTTSITSPVSDRTSGRQESRPRCDSSNDGIMRCRQTVDFVTKSPSGDLSGSPKLVVSDRVGISGSSQSNICGPAVHPKDTVGAVSASHTTPASAKEVVGKKSDRASVRKSLVDGVEPSDVGEYGQSLDRLNSSLSELQGEILRLSLQQDQIKNLVVSSDTRGPSTSSSSSPQTGHPTSTTSQHPGREQFYLFPRKSSSSSSAADEPTESVNIAGRTAAYAGHQAPSNLYRNIPSMAQTSHHAGLIQGYPGAPYGSDAPHQVPDHIYMGAAFNQFPPNYYVQQEPMQAAGRFYLPPTAPGPMYVGMYGHESQPPPVYPVVPATGYPTTAGHWPTALPPQQLPMHSRPDPQNIPDDLFRSRASAAGSTVNKQPPTGITAKTQPSGRPPQAQPSIGVPQLKSQQKNSNELPGGKTTKRNSISEQVTAAKDPPQSQNEESQSSRISQISTVDLPADTDSPVAQFSRLSALPSVTQLKSVPSKPGPPASEAFFMQFDDDEESAQRATRLPPGLIGRPENIKKKDAERTAADTAAGSSIQQSTNIQSAPQPVTAPTPGIAPVTGPAVGFVIDDIVPEEEAMSSSSSELEKRRLRILELQAKRKEELETKKQQIEVEQNTRSEAERTKKELADQKRAEDKARRDAIFASYLQRKAADDDSGMTTSSSAADDDVAKRSTPASSAVTRRQAARGGKQPRPKSQPPPADSMTSALVTGTVKRVDSPASLEMFRSNERLNVGITPEKLNGGSQLDPVLCFGNSANRRPPTPDRLARYVGGVSGDFGDGNNQLVNNYAGPKLFVKPSQKSNKTIVMNAIKDCCLAGSVNQDTKNKVIEEISRSESNHFVILFRDSGQQYKGLYTYNPDREEVFKIHGVGPKQLTDKMMEKFLKYNSGAKTFTEVTSTKHLSATIDAVIILSSLWQKKPVGVTGQLTPGTSGQNRKMY